MSGGLTEAVSRYVVLHPPTPQHPGGGQQRLPGGLHLQLGQEVHPHRETVDRHWIRGMLEV